MTTYNWSSLTNGQIIPFVSGADVLHFDDVAISAADLGWTFGDTSSPPIRTATLHSMLAERASRSV